MTEPELSGAPKPGMMTAMSSPVAVLGGGSWGTALAKVLADGPRPVRLWMRSADAAAEFNRFNTRKLELADAGVAALRVGGNFRWANTDDFVNLLELGFPVRAERRPDRIVLHSR